MVLKDLQLEVTDQDHIWVNGRQFISLRRFQEAVKENKKICAGYDADYLGELICRGEPKSPVEEDSVYCCPICGKDIVFAGILNALSYKRWLSMDSNYCPRCGQHLDWKTVYEEKKNDLS